jgi:spore coat protein CotH
MIRWALMVLVGFGLLASGFGAVLAQGVQPAAPAAATSPGSARLLADPPVLYDDTVVHDVSITVAASNWLSALGCQTAGGRPGATPVPEADVRADLEVDGTHLADIGIRCKGNSSLNIAGTKKPLNITTDAFVGGQDLWGFDVINLNNGWSDPSQVREALALEMLGEVLPSSRFSFARVTLNGKYLGLYTLVEQINGEFADYWYPDDNGLIIKGDSPVRIAFNSSQLTWLGESLASYKSKYEVKGSAAGTDEGYVLLRELVRALDAPVTAGGLSEAAFPEGIRQVLDVETVLWYLATSNIIANFDSYYVGKNYYLYHGQRDERFHMIPWDLGLSFGLFGLQSGQGGPGGGSATPAARVDPFAQETEAGRPLIRRLLAVPGYRADYLAHYRAFLTEVFTPERIEAVGQRYQDLIHQSAADEVAAQGSIAGAFTVAQFEQNLRQDVTVGGGRPGPGMGTAPGILSLVGARRTYLGGLPALRAPDVSLAAQSHAPAQVTVADSVAIEARFAGSAAITGVELRYRVDGGFEEHVTMVAGAGGTWRATIPPQRQGATVGYVFRLALADGSAAFFPTATLTRPFNYDVAGITLPRAPAGKLVISEIMADNDTTVADEKGDFDDWVEVTNRGTSPIDLGGYYLSDRPDDPWAFALPAGVLAPGGHTLVWCDNETGEGAAHAPFRLAGGGEQVLLSTRDATVDAVTFPALGPDQSTMRLPESGDTWVTCDWATPREANRCDPGVRRTATPTTIPSSTATLAPPTATARPPTATRVVPTTARPTARPTSTATPAPTGGRVWLPMALR